MKLMLKLTKLLFVFFFLFFAISPPSFPLERYNIDSEKSEISCSVGYLLNSKIKAKFFRFHGTITYDPNNDCDNSIQLAIETASLKAYPKKIEQFLQSARGLDAAKYKEIEFLSETVKCDGLDCLISGVLNLHGQRRKIKFPFRLSNQSGSSSNNLVAEGVWIINRKDFKIIWSRLFDRGGVVVRNRVSIPWKITAVLAKNLL